MPYTYPLPDVDIALIDEWLRFGAPGVCNTGASGCLGDFVLPCIDVQTHDSPRTVEKGAYDIQKLATARNCAVENKVCVAGDCQ